MMMGCLYGIVPTWDMSKPHTFLTIECAKYVGTDVNEVFVKWCQTDEERTKWVELCSQAKRMDGLISGLYPYLQIVNRKQFEMLVNECPAISESIHALVRFMSKLKWEVDEMFDFAKTFITPAKWKEWADRGLGGNGLKYKEMPIDNDDDDRGKFIFNELFYPLVKISNNNRHEMIKKLCAHEYFDPFYSHNRHHDDDTLNCLLCSARFHDFEIVETVLIKNNAKFIAKLPIACGMQILERAIGYTQSQNRWRGHADHTQRARTIAKTLVEGGGGIRVGQGFTQFNTMAKCEYVAHVMTTNFVRDSEKAMLFLVSAQIHCYNHDYSLLVDDMLDEIVTILFETKDLYAKKKKKIK